MRLNAAIWRGECIQGPLKPEYSDSKVRANRRTVDAPQSVQKKDEKSPQGDELKAPFGELVVTGCRQMATRADCGRTLVRSYGHSEALFVGAEAGALVYKTPEAIAAV
jgi:hypothetical protein